MYSSQDELWKIYLKFIDMKNYMEQTKESDLTPQQMNYLKIIGEQKQVSLSELADLTQNSKPTVSEMVNKLIQLNLAYKERCSKDNRRAYIHLTPSGTKCLQGEKEIIQQLLHQMISSMDQKDLDTIMSILKKYQ